MYREKLTDLVNWKKSKYRAPLIIRGARQTGKTWIIREHAKEYTNYIEINLEESPKFIPIFEKYYGEPDKITEHISLIVGKKIIPGKTLLFIDEIGESKDAILSLRYFKEKMSDLHVCSAGSLLEFTLKDMGFPVGRIDFIKLYPLSFNEFLIAMNRDDLVDALKKQNKKQPIDGPVHDLLVELFFTYSLIGGMPEVVKAYVDTKDLKECEKIGERIVISYRADFNKYAKKTEISNLKLVFDSIPRLIGNKFIYSHVDKSIKSRDLSKALSLLVDAGLAYKIHHSSSNGRPLSSQINRSKFKVFFLDTGLCLRILGFKTENLIEIKKDFLANKGGLTEQAVCQELISLFSAVDNPNVYYWHREAKSSTAEVDFVVEHLTRIVPVEVKSGSYGNLKSLHLFLKEKNKHTNFGVKVSPNPFEKHDNLYFMPIYNIRSLLTVSI